MKEKHDANRVATTITLSRPTQKAIPMATIPNDLVPLFDLIDRRLAKAKALAGERADDSELTTQLLVTVLRGVAGAANTIVDTLTSGEQATGEEEMRAA